MEEVVTVLLTGRLASSASFGERNLRRDYEERVRFQPVFNWGAFILSFAGANQDDARAATGLFLLVPRVGKSHFGSERNPKKYWRTRSKSSNFCPSIIHSYLRT